MITSLEIKKSSIKNSQFMNEVQLQDLLWIMEYL